MKINKFRKVNQDPSKGTVFTPKPLVVEILSKIPKDVYLNPKATYLVPAFDNGMFIYSLYEKLTEEFGYTDEDVKSRIFGVEFSPIFINPLKRREFQVLLMTHDEFLSHNFNMKFDVIVGNPPYQETREHNKKITGNGAPWVMFTLKAIELLNDNGYLGYIIPDSWCAPTYDLMGSRKSIFNDYFKKYNLTYINLDVKKYFTQVGITPSVFILQKNELYKNTEVQNNSSIQDIDINKFSFIPKDNSDISLNIHSKILKSIENTVSIKMRWTSDVTNIKISKEMDDVYKYPMIDHHSYKPVRYGNYIDPDSKRIKLLFPYVGNYQVIKDSGNLGAKPQVSLLFLDTENEMESAYSFYSSKLISFIINSNKWTQYLLIQILNFIKTPKFDKIYSDEEIYDEFELTKEERKYIEDNVR